MGRKADGKGARKLTDGEKDETIYRVTRTDFENNYLDDSKPIFLSAYGDKTKKIRICQTRKG